jgi:hypothetical protein
MSVKTEITLERVPVAGDEEVEKLAKIWCFKRSYRGHFLLINLMYFVVLSLVAFYLYQHSPQRLTQTVLLFGVGLLAVLSFITYMWRFNKFLLSPQFHEEKVRIVKSKLERLYSQNPTTSETAKVKRAKALDKWRGLYYIYTGKDYE